MKDAELEKGFYWVKWPHDTRWEPAGYTGWWFRIGRNRASEPEEIGPRIPQYTDTL